MWDYYYSQAKDKWVITMGDRDVADAVSREAAKIIVDGLTLLEEQNK